jgi:thymidylate synthase
MQFDFIVAVDMKWGISKGSMIPWAHTLEGRKDMDFFRKFTKKPATAVIMGRKTWESIPEKFRPLRERINIVISGAHPGIVITGANTQNPIVSVTSFNEALKWCGESTSGTLEVKNCIVIGGAQIYEQALKSVYLRCGYITHINGDYNCDTFFPYALLNPQSRDNMYDRSVNHVYEKLNFSNWQESDYLSMCERILSNPFAPNRTGVRAKSSFHEVLRFSLFDKVRGRIMPLLTTKNTYWRGIYHELVWFLRGSTDTRYLRENGIRIWDGNSTREFLDSRGLHDNLPGEIGPCFTGTTRVLTLAGYKPIKDMKLGEMVYTDKGNWKKVTKLFDRTYAGTMISITTEINSNEIEATPEHPFLTKSGFVEAGKLVCDQFVGLKIDTQSIIPIFYNGKVPSLLSSPDEWFVLGYIFGSGGRIVEIPPTNGSEKEPTTTSEGAAPESKEVCTQTPKKYRVCFNIRDGSILKKIRALIKTKRLNYDDNTYYSDDFPYLAPLLTFEDGDRKYIPEWVQQGPAHLIKSFLMGCEEAIGGSNTITPFSLYSILLGVQRLYFKVGVLVGIKGLELVSIQNPKSYIENGYVWCSLAKISVKNNSAKVYNITVEEDNTYVVENIAVHNCYGHQWRNWGGDWRGIGPRGVDQIKKVIDQLINEPWSRRILVSAWNVSDLDLMALPPCHYSFQFIVEPSAAGTPYLLNCVVNMRSADLALGVPFNIASYALLTHIISLITGLTPGNIVLSMSNCHIYENHIEGVLVQIQRKPRLFPTLTFSDRLLEAKTLNIDDVAHKFTVDDYIIKDYAPYPSIKLPMAI